MRHLLVMAVVIALATAAPARAEGGVEDWFVALLVLDGIHVVGGLATAAINGTIAGLGQRPSRVQLVAGYIFGLLNIVLGATSAAVFGEPDLLRLGVGIPLISIGSLGIGVTVLGHTRPDAPPPVRLSLVPLAGPDRAGGMIHGVGLRISAF